MVHGTAMVAATVAQVQAQVQVVVVVAFPEVLQGALAVETAVLVDQEVVLEDVKNEIKTYCNSIFLCSGKSNKCPE